MNFDEITKELNELASNQFEIDVEKHIIKVVPENWLTVAKILIDEKLFLFDYLMCITSYDLGENKQYGLAYNYFSTKYKHYLEVRIEINDIQVVPSVSHIWRTADWHEREAYDMMGIKFKDHPNFKRILLSEDWDGHPLRKDYKEPDYYHGMLVPKDKSYWE